MVSQRPRIAGLLIGDIYHEPPARVKYGQFFAALARQFRLVDVCDVKLHGPGRYFNALRTLHPDRKTWRERFYKNILAFRQRSRQAKSWVRNLASDIDVVLQVGVTFDSTGSDLPVVLYLDYTASLSARKRQLGRSPFNQEQRRQWLAMEEKAYRRAAHICVRSRQVRLSLMNDYGIEPQKITIVGGGVNFNHLPKRVSRSTNGVTTALFIGKEFYRKGGDVLLQAFGQAQRILGNCRLLMVTNGPISASLPLDGVEVIEPTWDRQKIAALYAKADFFVLPSRLETWGDVFLEAMAYSLPCIGVDDDAMGDIILGNQTGTLVPRDDVSALTRVMVELFTDPSRRQAWGAAGRRRVEEYFTWDKVVDRLAPILIDVSVARSPITVQEEYR